MDKIAIHKLSQLDLLYSGQLWGELDYDIYQKLLSESETIIDLNFQNACKDIYYVLVDGVDSYLPIESSKLTLNDSDRFEMTGLESTNLMQLYYKKNQDNNINIY